MLAVSIPKSLTFSALVDTATKCFAIASSSPRASSAHSRAERALVIVSCGGEVWGAGDERRLVGEAAEGGSEEGGGVAVGAEADRRRAPVVWGRPLGAHPRPGVGPADPDVDDVADRLAGVAAP